MEITSSYCDDTTKYYTESEDQYTFIRAAADAIQDGDLQAFQRNIKKIDMSGYMDPGGLGKEFLIPAFIINEITKRDIDNGNEYVQAILDLRPNLDLPFIKGKNFSYIDFLNQCQSVINSMFSNKIAAFGIELNKMALVIEADLELVTHLFTPDRKELETLLQKIDFILDQVRHCRN